MMIICNLFTVDYSNQSLPHVLFFHLSWIMTHHTIKQYIAVITSMLKSNWMLWKPYYSKPCCMEFSFISYLPKQNNRQKTTKQLFFFVKFTLLEDDTIWLFAYGFVSKNNRNNNNANTSTHIGIIAMGKSPWCSMLAFDIMTLGVLYIALMIRNTPILNPRATSDQYSVERQDVFCICISYSPIRAACGYYA